jgi:hypothetical protein
MTALSWLSPLGRKARANQLGQVVTRKFIAAESDGALALTYPDWRALTEQQTSRSGAAGAISAQGIRKDTAWP